METLITDDARHWLIEKAARAFPNKPREQIAAEAQEYHRLLLEQFFVANGTLEPHQEQRLKELDAQFTQHL